MKPFKGILEETEIAVLAAFVSEAFVSCRDMWPDYHTVENGWPDHRARYQAAYPYVLGERPLLPPDGQAGAAADAGRRLFREACSLCHDPAARPGVAPLHLTDASSTSEPDAAASEVHDGDEPRDHDAEYASKHDEAPTIADLTAEEAHGERLYQDNCAICHAADGTGRNWIGSFLQPHPTDFTDSEAFDAGDTQALQRAILDGLEGSSMPAFRSALTGEDAAAIVAYMRRAFVAR